jgi:hypothetical protein
MLTGADRIGSKNKNLLTTIIYLQLSSMILIDGEKS